MSEKKTLQVKKRKQHAQAQSWCSCSLILAAICSLFSQCLLRSLTSIGIVLFHTISTDSSSASGQPQFRRRHSEAAAAVQRMCVRCQTNSPHWLLSSGSLRPCTSTTFFQFSVSEMTQRGTARFCRKAGLKGAIMENFPVFRQVILCFEFKLLKRLQLDNCSLTHCEAARMAFTLTGEFILPSSGDICEWRLALVQS